ncbi:DUF547 domain-containing protein [bacterium]|nr:DUF547 domain-containing protein [bacterium]
MNPKVLILCLLLIGLNRADAENQHLLFSSVLQKNVHDGKVNYRQICKDVRLEQYIAQLKSTNPDRLKAEKDRLAFWINAYNAYTVKAICDHYPIKSINDLHSGGLILGSIFKATIWDKDFVVINNKPTTLNSIEHEIVRPIYKDPRAHFALVCASKSCPDLRPEAFEGDHLEQQLDDQARIFLSDPMKNQFDVVAQKAYISKIFDWYGKDFGRNDHEILAYLTKFLPSDIADAIRSKPDHWKVYHKDYDWSLNE